MNHTSVFKTQGFYWEAASPIHAVGGLPQLKYNLRYMLFFTHDCMKKYSHYNDHEPRHVHLKCFRVCSDDGCSFASAAPFCMCRAVAIRMSTMPGPEL